MEQDVFPAFITDIPVGEGAAPPTCSPKIESSACRKPTVYRHFAALHAKNV